MTEEQIKKKADKYLKAYTDRSIHITKDRLLQLMIREAFIDGYHEGFKDCAKSRLNVTTISDYPIKDEWHDLEKDPTDLPKEEKQYVVKAKDLDGDITVWICWYWTETKTFTGSYLNEMNVIKWKEIE